MQVGDPPWSIIHNMSPDRYPYLLIDVPINRSFVYKLCIYISFTFFVYLLSVYIWFCVFIGVETGHCYAPYYPKPPATPPLSPPQPVV